MWTFPAVKDLASCIELQLQLLEDWVRRGLSTQEVRFAQNYLSNSHCFEVDTPAKRLDNWVDLELYSIPVDQYLEYVQHVRAVSTTAANKAVRERIDLNHLRIVVVATADDVLPQLSALPGIDGIDVVPYDRSPYNMTS